MERSPIIGANEYIYPLVFGSNGSLHDLPMPQVRITTCGLLSIAILKDVVSTDPPLGRYEILTLPRFSGHGQARVLTFLKLLLSHPERCASRDWLTEHLRRGGNGAEDAEGPYQNESHEPPLRLDKLASELRKLFCPDKNHPHYKELCAQLVWFRAGTSSGDGYGLAAYPLIWIDADAISALVWQAARAEHAPDVALPLWERAYALASQGTYLLDEPYSDWAKPRRREIAEHLGQCVHALARLYLVQSGEARHEQALVVLRTYCQQVPTDEDALCLLMEVLAIQQRHSEALKYYQRFADLCERESIPLAARTQEIATYLRTKPIQREQAIVPTGSVVDSTTVSSSLNSTSLNPLLSGFSHALIQSIIETVCELEGTGPLNILDPMTRRTAIGQLLNVLGSINISTLTSHINIDSERLLKASTTSVFIDEDLLEDFEKLTDICWKLLRGSDLATVGYLLSKFFPQMLLLAQQSSKHQGALANFIAQGYNISGLLAGQQDDLSSKLKQSQLSEQYSKLADNRNLEITALIQQCVTFDYQKQHQKSLQTYQKALSYIQEISPLLQTRVYAGLAGSYARCGQQEKMAQQFIGLAKDVKPVYPEKDPSFVYADCGDFTIPLWEGRVYFELGRFQQAWEVFSHVESQKDISERIRTEFLNHLLETSIAQKDMGKSLLMLENAVHAAIRLKSERRYREVRESYQMMRMIWRDEPKVKEAADLFQL